MAPVSWQLRWMNFLPFVWRVIPPGAGKGERTRNNPRKQAQREKENRTRASPQHTHTKAQQSCSWRQPVVSYFFPALDPPTSLSVCFALFFCLPLRRSLPSQRGERRVPFPPSTTKKSPRLPSVFFETAPDVFLPLLFRSHSAFLSFFFPPFLSSLCTSPPCGKVRECNPCGRLMPVRKRAAEWIKKQRKEGKKKQRNKRGTDSASSNVTKADKKH